MQTLLETRVMKVITYVVLTTFTMWILEPAVVAARTLVEESSPTSVPSAKPVPEFSQTLAEMAEHLQQLSHDTPNLGQLKQQLKAWRQTLEELDRSVLQDFANTAKHLQEKSLPAEILQRHEAAVASYRADLQTLLDNLTEIETSDSPTLPAKANQAWQHLQKQLHKPHAPVDPNHLPFSIPDGKVRVPKETPEELQQLLPTGVKVAADTLLPGLLEVATAPGPEYLVETPEVQITPEIQALAESLEHNPVKIYSWVRDNIHFIPSYGSIQGSQMTLETQAGNAFDTASLLIALLRAAGLYARYQYGTVRIPIEKIMNWVGEVTAPEAAIQLLAQGGIPVVAQTQGGVIKFVKLEHVWVQAWVDFEPSRGAKHLQGDTWVPLDASFKQYQYTVGMNLPQVVPFEVQAFADHLTQTTTINETEGWVSGIDQTYIQNQLQNYQTQLEAYITQTKPNATMGEVLGTQTIISENRPVLAAGLPYQLVAKGNTYAALPDSLRKGFQFSLYANDTDRVLDNPQFTFSRSLPALAGKRLTLSFTPATEADRQVIESYLPEVPPDGQLDPATLPTSLPGYLIKLKAELKLNGEIVATAGPFTMGTELSSVTKISKLTGDWHEAVNKPIVGELHAICLDLQGISKHQTGVLADDALGWRLHKAARFYFYANDTYLKLLDRGGSGLAYRQPSFGSVSTHFETVYRFGIPRQVSMTGILVDMDVIAQSLWTRRNDVTLYKALVGQTAQVMSTLEHRLPEVFFTNQEYFSDGVSAVKALAVAAQQGQKIYTLTTANVRSVLPGLTIDDAIKTEIAQAVAAGKEARVSAGKVNIGLWQGTGYIITDPVTGGGAYRISGGSNGGFLSFDPELIIALQAGATGMLAVLLPEMAVLQPVVDKIYDSLQCADELLKQLIWYMVIILLLVLLAAMLTNPIGRLVGPAVAGSALMALADVAVAAKEDNCVSTIVYGFTTPTGKSLMQTTQHIANAIAEGKPTFLTRKSPTYSRRWLEGTTVCNPKAREHAENFFKSSVVCDEYPFASSEEGGEVNYYAGNVSLRFVIGNEGQPQGGVMSQFYQKCGVAAGLQFQVETNSGEITRGYDSGGKQCYP